MGRTEMSLVSFLISKLRIREFPGDSERNAVSSPAWLETQRTKGWAAKRPVVKVSKYSGHSRLLSRRAGCQTRSPQ